MEKLHICEYRDGDIDVIHSIDAICFPEGIAFSRLELLSYVSHRNCITRIARLSDSIVGFAIGKIERPNLGHILTLDVIPGMRRHRIGTALMTSLHEEFCRRGARISILEVDIKNAAARRFYEGLHYQFYEFLPGYYRGRSDACRMLRTLTLDSGRQPIHQ